MIFLYGLLADEPMSMVHSELRRAGVEFFFLDHRKIFVCDIEYAFDHENGPRCVLHCEDARVDLGGVRAAYLRPYDFRDYREMDGRGPGDPIAVKASGFEAQLQAFLDASDALVINRSEPSATINSKPYQMSVIRRAGFKIPQTLVTNDRAAAERFLADNGEVIHKSASSGRSIVERISADPPGGLPDVTLCPTLFQKVVPGTNYRAHVVNGEVHAVRIESSRLDKRRGETTMVVEELPADVARKCRDLNSLLGLHFSGMDLMRTPDDDWYCFDVNPSPAYSYFQLNGGSPISTAVAKFMIEANR